jgi:hypothetical protein
MNEHALVIFGLFVPSISAELALMPYLSPIYPGHIDYWTELTEPTEVTEEEEPSHSSRLRRLVFRQRIINKFIFIGGRGLINTGLEVWRGSGVFMDLLKKHSEANRG